VLAGTVALLAFVLWDLDLHVAWAALSSAHPVWIVPTVATYTLAHVVRGYRLRALVGIPVSSARLFSINAIGYLAINVVPFRLGEMVRPYLLAREDGVPFGRGVAAVFIERLFDTAALLAMLTAATLIVDLPPSGFVVGGIDVLHVGQRSAAAIVVVGSVAALGLVLAGEALLVRIEALPLGQRVGVFVRRFHEGVHDLLRRPARFVWLALLTAGIWGAVVTGVWCSLRAFDGVAHTFGAGMFTWTATLATTAAIPTPGFFGSYELGCAGALFALGAPLDVARTVAVAVHLLMFSYTVIVGVLFVVLEGISFRAIVTESQTAPQTD
jgi:glycosyltransferase 2 family protein